MSARIAAVGVTFAYATDHRLVGGLLAGGALVSRRDLFRAAVLQSPLLDMLRYDRFPPANGWTPEFGAPAEAGAFAWAARLQASTSGDPAERPVLLWIERADAGASDSPALQLLVDERVFLMWQLGMK
jgi:hypothetical protein